MREGNKLVTKHNKARYGYRAEINGIPVAKIKSGKRMDILTAEEFVEDLYGKPVERIVFKDE